MCVARARRRIRLRRRGGQPSSSATSCFVVELGMKGNVTNDADEEPVLFSDGIGPSQLGYLDCTATGPQNIVWEIMNGCPPLTAPQLQHEPVCPPAANLFTLQTLDPVGRRLAAAPLRQDAADEPGQRPHQGPERPHLRPDEPKPSPNPPTRARRRWVRATPRGGTTGSTTPRDNPKYGFARRTDGTHGYTNFDPQDPRSSTSS